MKRTISLKQTCILSFALLVWSGTVNGQSEEQIKRFNEEREGLHPRTMEPFSYHFDPTGEPAGR